MILREHSFILAMVFLAAGFTVAAGCKAGPQKRAIKKLEFQSPDFAYGANIPKEFTCDGEDVSPAFTNSPPPGGTQSYTLIADDPDAPGGTWVHWVIFDMSADGQTMAIGTQKLEQFPDGSRQGRNDFGKIGYGGPCPPPGKVHRYFFKLYALDKTLNLPPGATKKDVERAMRGHILAQGEWMGRYAR